MLTPMHMLVGFKTITSFEYLNYIETRQIADRQMDKQFNKTCQQTESSNAKTMARR
jgi:hypothetical protein